MIYTLKTSFSKSDTNPNETCMLFLKSHRLDGEEFIKEMPHYKSLDVFAFFTNKRIIFVRTTNTIGTLNHPWEIEFLPYKSIQRVCLLESKLPVSYKLDVFLFDNITFSFVATDQDEALFLSKTIGTYIS